MLANIKGDDMVRFLWKQVLTRFGILRILVSDNRAQFVSSTLQQFCEKYNIEHRFAPVYYPQASNESNHIQRDKKESGLEWGIRGILDRGIANGVMVSVNYTSHATSETPFSLVYGTEVVLPAEVGLPTWRHRGFDEIQNSRALKEQLNFIDEIRDKALFTTQKI
ncbi:hypothetical protein LIER_04121 [Lithospermum erythrorhizon]|uniref:Integrase catalytic domain-containing protein n=1 Tax=Lithospermum erythrorhizon TaxID=34254 RepID=A0AAV3NW11_LITER